MNLKISILIFGCFGIAAVIFWMDRAAFETERLVIERTELSPDSDEHFIFHFQLINAERHPPMTGFAVCEIGFDTFLGRKIESTEIDKLIGIEIPVKYRPKQFLWMQPTDAVQKIHDHYEGAMIWPIPQNLTRSADNH